CTSEGQRQLLFDYW
nr:immunoglobulin heavy chain junction region [Macaca mulatta]